MNPFYSLLIRLYEESHPAEIIYQSASGELSHRVIFIKKITAKYVYGYCTLRQTTRTFSLHNILSAQPQRIKTQSPTADRLVGFQ